MNVNQNVHHRTRTPSREGWTQNVVTLSDQYINVTGNVVVSAGLIAYLGAFTSEYRNMAVRKWVKLCKQRNIPCSNNPSLVHTS